MNNEELIGRLENPITEDLHGYAAVLLGETMGLAADVIREQQAEIERLKGKWGLPAHVKQAAAFIVEEMGEQFAQRLIHELEYRL